MIYGYARVSTRFQKEDRQMDALHTFGIPDARIFVDHWSGKDFARPQYQRLLRKLKPKDVFVTKSIDRMGRNYDEILENWRIITKKKQAEIVILDMPLLDTRSKRDLTGKLMANVFLQFLSYVAETERNLIRQRQMEGIAAAKDRGMRFGREPIPVPAEFSSVYEKWKRKELSAHQAGKALHVSRNTFLKWAHEAKQSPRQEEEMQSVRP